MNDQKLENLLNLALESTEEERARSVVLGSGYDPMERVWEVIIKYTGNLEKVRQTAEEVVELFGGFAVLYIKESALDILTDIPEVTYVEKPKPLYFAIQDAKAASCITTVRSREQELSGKGILFCCVDSGAAFNHPEFRKEDGSTRILYLWDQSMPGNPPEGYSRGTEYTRDQLNNILLNDSPQTQSLPGEDVSGHGTGVLGIGAGNSGVAYDSDLIVVKLGKPQQEGFPRTTQLMEGVDYCIRKAAELSRPAAINISFGNNYGAHDGSSLLELYLDSAAGVGKNVICVGMGNEGVSGNHVSLVLTEGEPEEVEISVGEYEYSINLQIWKAYADKVNITIENPGGEIAGPLQERLGVQRFSFRDTDLLVYYGMPTPYSVQQEIYIDFLPKNRFLSSGIWKIRIEPVRVVWNLLQMWLPVSERISGRTAFLKPTPAGSFTVPAAAGNVISVAAYDSRTGSYADFSGRAFQVLPWNGKPDLAAPGVDLLVPSSLGGYGRVSGTSFATPFVTGSAALLMEWGIIRGNDPFLFGNKIKAYLRSGARELPGFTEIPNALIGYGALCLQDSLPEE